MKHLLTAAFPFKPFSRRFPAVCMRFLDGIIGRSLFSDSTDHALRRATVTCPRVVSSSEALSSSAPPSPWLLHRNAFPVPTTVFRPSHGGIGLDGFKHINEFPVPSRGNGRTTRATASACSSPCLAYGMETMITADIAEAATLCLVCRTERCGGSDAVALFSPRRTGDMEGHGCASGGTSSHPPLHVWMEEDPSGPASPQVLFSHTKRRHDPDAAFLRGKPTSGLPTT